MQTPLPDLQMKHVQAFLPCISFLKVSGFRGCLGSLFCKFGELRRARPSRSRGGPGIDACHVIPAIVMLSSPQNV